MGIEQKLLALRKTLRIYGKIAINKLFSIYVSGPIPKNVLLSCILCGTEENLTKEHVLPKWVFNGNVTRFFTTDANQLNQTYIKATLPACVRCNSDLLNSIERYIQKTLSEVDLTKRYYHPDEWENIIRWLEIIDFKFQVLDITTMFRAHKDVGYIPALADLPIAIIRDVSPTSVKSGIRQALKRITTKNKTKKANSLIVAKTNEKTFHYFHQSGQFIYLEIPTYNKAFFYFYDKEFKTGHTAKKEAIKIIESVLK